MRIKREKKEGKEEKRRGGKQRKEGFAEQECFCFLQNLLYGLGSDESARNIQKLLGGGGESI